MKSMLSFSRKNNKFVLIITISIIVIISFIFSSKIYKSTQAQSLSPPPILYFSDLTSGPNTGGQNNKGVFVSIYGKNFGATRGASYVTVGTGQADNYPVWTDTKISFQLGPNTSTGNITVTTSNGTSNTLPFTVRAGNIYFVSASSPNNPGSGTYVDPWRSPASYMTTLAGGVDGATCYFRVGTYSGEYGAAGWHSNFALASTHAGSNGNPNAFVGYPGETATISAPTTSIYYNFRAIEAGGYFVFSNLNCYAEHLNLLFGDNVRIVGNKVEGLKVFCNAGMIMINGYSQVYGNEVFGATTTQKTDHAIYVQEGTDADVGWNYIHDMNISEGPLMQCHHDDANANGWTWTNTRVHDNIFDMSAYPSRAFLVTDVGSASTIYFYNNVIKGPCWDTAWMCVSAGNGNVYYYNNTFYNVGGSNAWPFYIYSSVTSATIKNNLVYTTPSAVGYMYVESSAPVPVNENNSWYGIGSFNSKHVGNGGTNANAVEVNPLFINAASGDFHLQSISPAIDSGSSLVSSIVTKDFDGILRPQGSGYDIGAYEYYTGSTPEPESDPIVPPSVTLTKQVDPVKSPDGDHGAGESQTQSGDTLTYTITCQNTSSVEAKNIIITDKIPEGATCIEASAANGGIYNLGANELTWIISSLPAGASDQVSFQVKVD